MINNKDSEKIYYKGKQLPGNVNTKRNCGVRVIGHRQERMPMGDAISDTKNREVLAVRVPVQGHHTDPYGLVVVRGLLQRLDLHCFFSVDALGVFVL